MVRKKATATDAKSDDGAKIIALVNAARIAVWMGDYEGYAKCFVHAPYTTRWNASMHAGVFVRAGWEEISRRVKEMWVRAGLVPNPVFAYETKIENVQMRIMGDMAWVTYTQRYPGVPEHHGNGLSPTCELRILERHGGEWLIAFLGFLDPDTSPRGAALLELAADGTVLLKSPAAEAALAAEDDLVIRAGKLHIRDSRADQRLQAAIRWAAARDATLIPERGALPIVLEAGEGLPTKVWWVIAGSGHVFFSLGDKHRDAQRLKAATVVYELSPAQEQVAALIVDGLSLADIAARMKITPNTARTHLDRVFEKTGVRTQSALVRVLLSTAAPF
jgi:DNA-binding CsgD family transcriptional regulator